MTQNTATNSEKLPASEVNANELKALAEANGYDSIRFFIAPDKTGISPESVIDDMRAVFSAKSERNTVHRFE